MIEFKKIKRIVKLIIILKRKTQSLRNFKFKKKTIQVIIYYKFKKLSLEFLNNLKFLKVWFFSF